MKVSEYVATIHLYLCSLGSGDLNSSDFNPKWFLAEKHRSTSFGELKTGLRRLREELTKREEAPVLFMRDNLSTFLQAYDTLSGI